MRTLLRAGLLTGVLLLSACGADEHPAPSASTESVRDNGSRYTATSIAVRERTGPTEIEATLPQLAGGDPTVRDRFNAGMRASLADAARDLDGHLGDGELPSGGGESSRVTRIGEHVVAGVLITSRTFGGPHPVVQVGTIVIDDAARPILLPATLRDPDAAWPTLASLAPALVPAGDPPLDPPLATADTFAAWVPAPEGLRVYFPVSHAAGDYQSVLLPWDRIRDLFLPAALTTLSS
ncbi:hypothetical protein ACFYTQ_23740 [Nocardia sp. NPDC004068]|uniref:hypothetical protein n=1 Tax=Nocardia sp. NPDC004068 TaxID=3364303 RepID=UPI00369CDB72